MARGSLCGLKREGGMDGAANRSGQKDQPENQKKCPLSHNLKLQLKSKTVISC